MITRRKFAGAAAGFVMSRARAAEKRPNIISLLTDDHRWDALGCMGNPIIRTPHIDTLSREGVTFQNCFVTSSICMTSRASIFTGLHERTHGISSFSLSLPPEINERSYPELMRGAGYRVGFIGKWGLGGKLPEARFDYFQGFSGQGKYYHERDGRLVHLTQIMGEQALEFLDGCSGDQPFCLSVSFKAPHVQDEDPRQFLYDPAHEELFRDVRIPAPKTADDRYFRRLPGFLQTSEARKRWEVRFSTREKYQKSVKGYYRLIYGVDEVVGRIRRELQERGFAENTVLVFTGDNGFYLGEHGLAGKWYMHEESVRVPLIVHDPRLPEHLRGMRRPEMALNIDVAPTLLELAGVPVSPSVQGRSLLPLVRGEGPRWREEWFYSHLYAYKLIPKSEGIRTRRWKYIRYIESQPLYEELYDLAEDPLEENNLAREREHSTQLEKLRDRWRVWRDALPRWRIDERWDDPEVS